MEKEKNSNVAESIAPTNKELEVVIEKVSQDAWIEINCLCWKNC